MATGRRQTPADKDVEAFVERLERFLDSVLSDTISGISAGRRQPLEAGQIISRLNDVLIEAGLEREIAQIVPIYASELKRVETALRGTVDEPLSDVDLEIAEQLITFDADQITSTVRRFADDVKSSVMRSVLLGEQPDYKVIKERLGGRVAANIKTELNTATASFFRTVTVRKSEDAGFTKFQYFGPVDSLTRPFCARYAGKVLTKDEIQKLDNGQTPNPLITGGGYNCRHEWIPVE